MFKKIILTLGIGGALVATSVAAAATLQINNPAPVVQAADVTDLECDSDGVTIEFATELDDLSAYSLKVGDIDAACTGRTLLVQVRNGTTVLFQNSGTGGQTIVSPTTSVSFGGPILIADITEVSLIVE